MYNQTTEDKAKARQFDKCPECWRYLGKNFGQPWCSQCHVSYPDNLQIIYLNIDIDCECEADSWKPGAHHAPACPIYEGSEE